MTPEHLLGEATVKLTRLTTALKKWNYDNIYFGHHDSCPLRWDHRAERPCSCGASELTELMGGILDR